MKRYIYTRMIGQLIKITASKKLMVKISKELSRKISASIHDAYKRNKYEYKGDRTVFALDNESEQAYSLDETAYFVLITLDKYDKLLLAKKFEPLVKKQVAIQYRFQSYDFMGDDGRVQGINLVLTNINKSREQREEDALFLQADKAAELAEKRVIEETTREMFKDAVDAETTQGYHRRRRVYRDEGDNVIGEVGQLSKLLDAMDEAEMAHKIRDEALSACKEIEDEIEEDDVAAQLAAVKSLRFDN